MINDFQSRGKLYISLLSEDKRLFFIHSTSKEQRHTHKKYFFCLIVLLLQEFGTRSYCVFGKYSYHFLKEHFFCYLPYHCPQNIIQMFFSFLCRYNFYFYQIVMNKEIEFMYEEENLPHSIGSRFSFFFMIAVMYNFYVLFIPCFTVITRVVSIR